MSKRPRTPEPVRRRLRQEAFFGCARCGNPIIEYHHIVPWHEEKHFRPEDMVALCPTCHTLVGKQPRRSAYNLKNRPHNASTNRLNGYLATDEDKPTVAIGSNLFINCRDIVKFFGYPVLRYEIGDGQRLLSLSTYDPHGRPEVIIERNEVLIWNDTFYDILFSIDRLILKRRKRKDTHIEIDLRKDAIGISGRLSILGIQVDMDKIALQVSTEDAYLYAAGSIAVDLTSVFNFGDSTKKFVPPNLAMSHPRARLVTV